MKHSIKLNTETTFMKYGIILVFLLFIPLVSSTIIVDTSKIHIYMIDNVSSSEDTEITFRVDFNTSENPDINDKTFTYFVLNISSKEGLIWTSPDFTYIVESNITSENWDYREQYLQCLAEIIGFERGWQNCQNDLTQYEGENTTLCKEDLDECSLSVREKDLDLGAKNEKILNLEDEKEDTKNSKYIWGVIGLALGAGGFYLYQKRGGSPKEKAMSEFQKSQAR